MNPISEITVALGVDFLKSFAKLPGKQQSRVGQFIEKFRSNPMGNGINYEKIHGARDHKLWSVRIDQTYRGIVLKPETGKVYVLLWIDHHDEAYDWARRHTFSINPHTGSLQMVPVQEGEAEGATEAPPEDCGVFAGVKDKYLLRLGIPKEMLPLVRAVETERELAELESRLPQEAAEALYYLADGIPIEEVLTAMWKEAEPRAPVNTEDFATALENPDTRRRFHVVADSGDLAEMLRAPLDQWRVFLHPSQRKLVEMTANGPVRVLGGAGTGKTVVAMHRAKYLADQVFAGDRDRILFTTFTRNLAEDIKENLKKICSYDVLRRIDVINLDAWVYQLLRKHGYEYSLVFPDDARECWQEAMNVAAEDLDLEENFYREEWEHVVQAQGISQGRIYLKASRVGRGRRLSRLQRKQIWPVFEEYRAILNRQNKREFIDAIRDARVLLETEGDILPYKAVVLDEAQDMSMEAFRLIRQMIPESRNDLKNDLFIVGDAHQRIYSHRVTLGKCGIKIVGRSRKLRLNYRTTDEIRRWSVALLEGRDYDDLDGGEDSNQGYRSLLHGARPEIRELKTFDDEVQAIIEHLQKLQAEDAPLTSVCLVTRLPSRLEQYEERIRNAGIDVYRIKRSSAEDRSKPGIRTATMHRVKGIEFDHMIIAGVNDGEVPQPCDIDDDDNRFAIYEFENRERSLLYVAATRAKKTVLITSFGTPSSLL